MSENQSVHGFNFSFLSVNIILMSANQKLGLMIAITLLILALVVFSGEKRGLQSGSGAKVDLKRIEKQVSEGNLSLHPAEFYKKLGSPEDAE